MSQLVATLPSNAPRLGEWTVTQALRETLASADVRGAAPAGRGVVFFGNHFDPDAYQAAEDAGGHVAEADLDLWSMDRWALWLTRQVGAARGLGVMTACTASNLAIGLGYDWIADGQADWALVGGMELLHSEILVELDSLRMLSATGCRPFSSDHDGTIAGDGCGLLLLERWDRAIERGAPIRAELLGYGQATDTAGLSRLDPAGGSVFQAMSAALEASAVEPRNIGYINAGATGAPSVDDAELHALERMFGGSPPPTSSLKSQIGHSIGGAAAVEAIVTVQALMHQQLPPTLGLAADTPKHLDFVPHPRPHTFDHALNNAIAMGGHICTTVFRRWAA
jgi:3-oxoacyl-[acyl-carrier-protein] synthase II